MNINMNSPLKQSLLTRAWSHAADSWLPHFSLFFMHSPAKEVLMGVSHFSSSWLKFTLHLHSHHCSGCPPPHPPSPGPGVPCGSSRSSNTWEINQTLCWQPLTGKQEDGEIHETSGIHDRYFHDWLKKEERETEEGKQGTEGAVVFEGEKEFSF